MKQYRIIMTAAFIAVMCLGQSCTGKKTFEFTSAFYRIQIADTVPFIKYFSVDALGRSELGKNTVEWKPLPGIEEYELHRKSERHVIICRKGSPFDPLWDLTFDDKNFCLASFSAGENDLPVIGFRFSKLQDHATLLGLMPSKNKSRLPALLHFPDMGTFRIVADKPGTLVDYDASRMGGTNFISVVLPHATTVQKELKYTMEVTSVYPSFPGVENEKYTGFRRNYLNLFQINPRLQVLANNSCSDPCAFTLFMSSMLALKTPQFADSLSALDLVRMSVERYLNGMKAYGMSGYNNNWEAGNISSDQASGEPYDYLDTWPSLVISACNYIKGSGDMRWAARYYPRIRGWMDRQMMRDHDGNGLVEYELSGNSGSWDGVVRPANWWDTVGFGHEDAFSNAITYGALNLMIEIAESLDLKEDAEKYRALSDRLNKAYFKTFFNPATGVLAGWKSRDGKLHDYYFLMVNSMAVYYDLVPENSVKDIMLTLWEKMAEVGFNDFTLGLPGNLVSVRWEDYTHHDPRYGGGEKMDGSDAFQRYENGGASLNWSYFTLKAFKKAGLDEQLKTITDSIMRSVDKGAFQGSCTPGGMTKDWKAWNGECWGYEGFLCDGYLVLLALNPDDK